MSSLRQYQVDAVRFLSEQKRALLALPPGAGKTAVVATALPGTARPLIVAPNGPVLPHWQHELFTWSGIHGVMGTGTPKQRAAMREGSEGGALILNYECFVRDIDSLAEIPWDAVVFDESHRLKNRQTQTFKAARRLKPESLYLVSGTPVLNRAEEIWTSLHLMEPKAYRSFWTWAEQFFTISYPRYRRRIVREVGKIKSPEHAALLRKQVHERMFYRPLAEILPDLPPVTTTTYEIELSAAERKAHDSMLEHFWMELGDEVIQAPNDVAKQTRLRQLCSDWSVFGEAPGSKSQAVAQLVDELAGEPVVIFTAFRATAEALVTILPNAAQYHGGMSGPGRDLMLAKFKSGKHRQLVVTIRSIGEGVDGLQHGCHNAIFLDRDWTPARNDQAVARLHRMGQSDSVNVIHVVARDCMDDVVSTALTEKRSVIEAIIESRVRV